jgi:hypothetical protein
LTDRSERIGLALYLLGFLFTLWAASSRISAEKKHETSEILLDAQALGQWRQTLKKAPGELERELLDKGIASVAVAELHLDDLIEEGRLVAQSGSEFSLTLASGALGDLDEDQVQALQASLEDQVTGTYLLFRNPELSTALLPQIQLLFGSDVTSFAAERILWLPASQKTLRPAGLGFDPIYLKHLADLGFGVWLRPENRAGLTEDQLANLFKEWDNLPAVQGVIFGGPLNEALGYPQMLEQTAQSLKSLGWKLGYIELSPRAQQDGIETLVRKLPGQTVRVMAVSPPHQAKLSPYRVLGMYSLGARERNIRALYVRPFNVAGRPELDEEFLFALPAELEQRGPASVFDTATTPPPNIVMVLVLSVSAGALALLLLHSLGVKVAGPWWLLLLLPGLGFGLASAVGKGVLYRSLLALAIGMGAPLWAFLKWVYPAVVEPERGGLGEGLKVLALTSLMSLSAGLYLAALLGETTFLLGLDRFRGVKLLTLGTPLLVVAGFVVKKYSPTQIWNGLRSYVAVYQALLAGAVAALFGFLLLRSGNNAGGAASDWERTLRVVLDQALGVRPRFKEFMVAHPALVCAPLFASWTGFLPSLVLVLLGAIGQAGIVDTFAHVHTPLDVTLIRVALGVIFGGVIGFLAGGVFSFLEPIVRARVVDRFVSR